MGRPDILAPVGGQEQLIAAVRCGADAVYLGGADFNARRNAANFDAEGLAEAARYCRARGVKLYVTVNTMLMDGELTALERAAEDVAAAGADAVILQDMTAAELFARRYPTIHRVASTQTAVHNADGVRFLRDAGFQSFVLARELSLSEMEKIIASVDIPAEAFVHGAHCMSVSGMCALSAMLGGRSGNRGLCAQPCRLDWRCGAGDHVLSLKDMSLVEHIPELAEIGVATLKIEGRMKRPEYVAAAVAACCAARDGEPYDAETLRAVFSRSGFTDGYLTGHVDGAMFGCRTRDDVKGAEGVLRGLRNLYRRERQSIPVSMALKADADASRLTVSDGSRSISVSGPMPEPAHTRPLDAAGAEKSLAKTGGTQYYVNSIQADVAPEISLPASALNAMRREALAELDEARSEPPRIKRTDWTPEPVVPHKATSLPSPLWGRFYAAEQLFGAEALEKILLPVHEITPERIASLGKKLIAELPPALFPSAGDGLENRLRELREAGLAAVWADNIYGIELGQRLGLAVHGGFGLNIANSRALAFYEEAGLASAAISFELPMGAIRALGGSLPRGVAAYGRLPLMRWRNCPVRANIGCEACGGRGELTDRRGVVFPVECGQKRMTTLLNSVPLDIAGRDDPADYRVLWFTRESAAECAAVTGRFLRDERTDDPHTGGLYYRKLL